MDSPPPDSSPAESSRWENRLIVLLAIIAGMADVIGFLDFQVFTAHITGNIVLIFAFVALHQSPPLSEYLAIPVFAIAVAAIWLGCRWIRAGGRSLARALLLGQFLLLVVALVLSVGFGRVAPGGALYSGIPLVVVAAISCQYVLDRLAIRNGASTAVMTFNTTNFVLSLLDTASPGIPLTREPRATLKKSGGALIGFVAGCATGAAAASWMGGWAWLAPVIVAGVATVLY